MPTVEVVERPAAERPAQDSLDAIVEWLWARRGYAIWKLRHALSWRRLAPGLPLLRVTLHASTLHPQYLGVTFTWFRTTGQTEQRLIAHEVAGLIRYEDNPVRRVVWGGETLRRRLDVADAVIDFSILHDLKALGACPSIRRCSRQRARRPQLHGHLCDRPPGRLHRIGSRRPDARIATIANLG
jgi:hypothetical protein